MPEGESVAVVGLAADGRVAVGREGNVLPVPLVELERRPVPQNRLRRMPEGLPTLLRFGALLSHIKYGVGAAM